MEIIGKVIAVLPEFTTGGGKVKHSFVVETIDKYPQKIPFDVWGDDKWEKMNISVGADVTVSFDINGREYKGKYFVSLQAWKVVSTGGSVKRDARDEAVKAEKVPTDAPAPEQGDDGQLPF